MLERMKSKTPARERQPQAGSASEGFLRSGMVGVRPYHPPVGTFAEIRGRATGREGLAARPAELRGTPTWGGVVVGCTPASFGTRAGLMRACGEPSVRSWGASASGHRWGTGCRARVKEEAGRRQLGTCPPALRPASLFLGKESRGEHIALAGRSARVWSRAPHPRSFFFAARCEPARARAGARPRPVPHLVWRAALPLHSFRYAGLRATQRRAPRASLEASGDQKMRARACTKE